MKLKNIILVLGDDQTTLAAAQGIAKQLPNSSIRRFSPECLVGLSPEDAARITLVGHAHRGGYGQDDFKPKQFVHAFDEAIKKAGLQKEDIKRLRCFGCELGLMDKEGSCYAQKMANEFVLHGYHLKLAAFTNRHKKDPLQTMTVGVSALDGSTRIYGYKTGEAARQGRLLDAQLKEKREEIQRLQSKVSSLDARGEQGRKRRAIDKAERDFEILFAQREKLQVQINYESHPIKALDHNKKYQFMPSVTPQKLQEKIIELREKIKTCEHNIRALQGFDFSLVSHMRTTKKELEDELRTIEEYLATGKNKNEPPLEQRSTPSWIKNALQGIKSFFRELRMKSSAAEEFELSELSKESCASSYKNPMVKLGKSVAERPVELKLKEKEQTVTSAKKVSSQVSTSDYKSELQQLREVKQTQKQEEPQLDTHSPPVV